jgi:hypothetical protein
VGIDARGADEDSRAVVVGEDDGEAPSAEDPPTKILGGVDIVVDVEGVDEAPS